VCIGNSSTTQNRQVWRQWLVIYMQTYYEGTDACHVCICTARHVQNGARTQTNTLQIQSDLEMYLC